MKIIKSLKDEYKNYNIILSREEFDDLVDLCCYGGEGFIIGFYDNKWFKIYPDGGFSDFWTPDDDGYFMTVGYFAEKKTADDSYFETKFPENLEKAINESGRKPIESVITSAGRTEIVPAGYITMKVEPRKKSGLWDNHKLPKKKAKPKVGLHLIVNNECPAIRIKTKPRGKLYLIVNNFP